MGCAVNAAERLDVIEERVNAAHNEVAELCMGKRWTMQVPARPEKDSDLVISDALYDSSALVAALRAVLALHSPNNMPVNKCRACGFGFDMCPVNRAINAALDVTE